MPKTRNGEVRAESPAARSILILDDHAERQRALRTALTSAGYAVDTASESEGALALLEAHRPDLIVVDLQLPGPEGMQLAHRLLVDPDLETIPVVGLVADRALGEQRRSLEDLFDGSFADPVDSAELLARIETLLAQAAPAPVRAAPATAAAKGDGRAQAEGVLADILAGLPATQCAPGTAASLQPLAAAVPDNSRLPDYLRHAGKLTEARTMRGLSGFRSLIRLSQELVSGDPDPAPGFDALRSEYLDNRIAELSALERALGRADFTALASAGHNLKGTGAAYGFTELTELGRALEGAARANEALPVEVLLEKTEFYLSLVRSSPVVQ